MPGTCGLLAKLYCILHHEMDGVNVSCLYLHGVSTPVAYMEKHVYSILAEKTEEKKQKETKNQPFIPPKTHV